MGDDMEQAFHQDLRELAAKAQFAGFQDAVIALGEIAIAMRSEDARNAFDALKQRMREYNPKSDWPQS